MAIINRRTMLLGGAAGLAAMAVKAGEVRINNDFAVEPDGTFKLENDATVWDDLRVSLSQTPRGNTNPTVRQASSMTGAYLNFFDKGNEMTFTVQLPHSYKEGTNIYPHIHWMPDITTVSQTVGWTLQYSWQNYDANSPQVFPAMAVAPNSPAETTSAFTANTHLLTDLTGGTGLDGSGKKISSILMCVIKRANDNYTGAVGALYLDFHFQIDTLGSRQEYAK